jgi:hypothetical protein
MKQPALCFVPFGAIYLLWKDVHCQFTATKVVLRNLTFWIAAIFPLGMTCLILSYRGIFDKGCQFHGVISDKLQLLELRPGTNALKGVVESTAVFNILRDEL